jgi:choice-of-anchor A domain-containing protein/fibro-slime domain-containing protein
MTKSLLIFVIAIITTFAVPTFAVPTPPPAYVTIVGQCRDFTPTTNYDFEHYIGDDRGIFQSNLGNDGIPVYSGGYHPTITSATTVYEWYRDTPGVSMGPYSIPINLTQVSGGYQYNNQMWFPLDNMGFGNYANTGHNFGFTCVFRTQFTYQAGANQVFTFQGDDDVFVFINSKLAIDLGGVHGPETSSVNLDNIAASFGLVNGGTYSLDTFQNERHTTGSTFKMTTDLVLAPSSVCGNGVIESGEQCDGGSCCTTSCTFSSSSSVCRPSAGSCDVPETCTGSSSTCPSDSFASSSTVCRSSQGPCDVAESCTGSSASCPTDSFASSSTVCRPSQGPCDPSESCTGSSASCPTDIDGAFESACPGLTIPFNGQSYSLENYDVISFGDFNSNSGDVEGRVAVRNNANVGQWSVGYKTHSLSTDQTLPFALVVGGNLNWASGAVYPLPNGYANPYGGPEEDVWVGGSFTTQGVFPNAIDSNQCGANSGCYNQYFDAAQQCYVGFSAAWSAQADNVDHNVQWSGLYVTCADSNANTYYLTLNPSEFSQFTWVSLSNCNNNARWTINIAGTDDVTFSGGSFPLSASAVVYNVPGTRQINLNGYQLNGNLVAPFATVNQQGGYIQGKLIAGTVSASDQINKALCYFPQGTVVPPPPSNSICGNGVVEQGEQCDGGVCCTSSCTYVPSTTVCRPSIGPCDAPEYCTGNSAQCPYDVTGQFETACSGLTLTINGQTTSWLNYDVIVFGDYNAGTGDIEARAAFQNNGNLGAGWSVGYQTHSSSTDNTVDDALIVGRNLAWGSGQIYPNGQGAPFGGNEEYMFVGGTFNGPSYLAGDIDGTCNGNSGCLDSQFQAVQQCYAGYANNWAAQPDNVQTSISYDVLSVQCNSGSSSTYYMSLTASQLAAFQSMNIDSGCNANARWIVNVRGTDDVTISNTFPVASTSAVVWNVLGSERTIYLQNSELDGSLVAPYNTMSQSTGVVKGKVIVGDVASSNQINKYRCFQAS